MQEFHKEISENPFAHLEKTMILRKCSNSERDLGTPETARIRRREPPETTAPVLISCAWSCLTVAEWDGSDGGAVSKEEESIGDKRIL